MYKPNFILVPSVTMKVLTQEEIHLNNAGVLSDRQLLLLKRYGLSQLLVAGIFIILIVLSVFITNMKWNWLTAIWIIGGALFAFIYVYTAISYLKITKEDNSINKVSGYTQIKESGKRHRLLRVGEQSFFLLKNLSASIENGKNYTVYYLDNPRVVLGWIQS